MAPAEVVSIIVDEEKNSMDIAVAEDKLSQAIGRGGQNVRLASRLTGWHLNVMTEAQVREKSETEKEAARTLFVERLEVDAEIADILVQEGFSTIEEIAYVPEAELLSVEEFDADIVNELRNRARDALLTQMIADEEEIEAHRPADDLLELDGMDETVAYALAARGIVNREDLAEAAVDEIADIEGLDEESAGKLIMAARAHWFEDAEN
jgi:N utilization substance protein A